jgi:hypothetical protein
MSATLAERLAPSPLALLRSSLFAAAEHRGEPMRNAVLVTSKHFSANYTGPRLSQQHAVIWQALILEHRSRCGHDSASPLCIRQTDLLRAIGRTDTSTPARKWLWEKLRDLQQAIVELTSPKHRYSGQLVGEVLKDEQTGAFEIHLPSKLAVLLSDELAFIDLDRKLGFGRNQLACWLHDFISTQHNTKHFPFAVKELHALSGSPLALRQFRPRLRKALTLLQAGTDPLLLSARINAADQLIFTKAATKVLMKHEVADPIIETRYRKLDRVEEALERRGRVAL